MIRPGWGIPINMIITVFIAPSMIIQSYLMVDKMIVLMVPTAALPYLPDYPKGKKPEDYILDSVMEFFYWMLGIALFNMIFATFRNVSS
jgi:hypothetical protein